MKTPPWLHDSHPEYWHRLAVAARYYFKKHPNTIRLMASSGYLNENGIPTYFDGRRWYVRVPLVSNKPTKCTKRISADT